MNVNQKNSNLCNQSKIQNENEIPFQIIKNENVTSKKILNQMIDNKQISKKGISSIKFNLKLKDEFFLRKHFLNEKQIQNLTQNQCSFIQSKSPFNCNQDDNIVQNDQKMQVISSKLPSKYINFLDKIIIKKKSFQKIDPVINFKQIFQSQTENNNRNQIKEYFYRQRNMVQKNLDFIMNCQQKNENS